MRRARSTVEVYAILAPGSRHVARTRCRAEKSRQTTAAQSLRATIVPHCHVADSSIDFGLRCAGSIVLSCRRSSCFPEPAVAAYAEIGFHSLSKARVENIGSL